MRYAETGWGRLKRNWKLLGTIFLGAGILTYLLAMLLPKTYRAEATVLLPNVEETLATRRPLLPVSDIARFFRSPELAREVIQQFELDRKYGLTVSSLLEGHLNASVSRDSQGIRVTVGLPDAEAAKKSCDFIAREGARRFAAAVRGVYATILEGLQSDYQQADKVYLQAVQELEAIRASKQPDALRMRAIKIREEASGVDMLQIALTAQQEKNTSLRISLEKISPTIQLEMSLVDSPELQQTVSSRSGKPLQELLSLKMRRTVLNPSYHSAYSELVLGLAEEERLKGQIRSIQETIKTDDPKLAEVEGRRLTTEAASPEKALGPSRVALQDIERSLAKVDRETGHLEVTIEARSRQLQRIADACVEVEMDLQRMSHPAEVIPAVAPDHPVWPRKGLLALAVASLVTLAIWAGPCRSREDEI